MQAAIFIKAMTDKIELIIRLFMAHILHPLCVSVTFNYAAMSIIYQLFGEGKEITLLQMTARSAAMFFIAFLLLRMGGVRIFGKQSALDDVIVIMLGAVLSRGIVGANPFFSTVAAGAVMVLIHKLLTFIAFKNKKADSFLKGNKVGLFHDGHILYANLERSCISLKDLLESLRLETNHENFDAVEEAFLENNGRISFILKKTVKNCDV